MSGMMNQIRPGRPELPLDWAALTDIELRERLKLMGYSDKMIESELANYNTYRERIAPKAPEESDTEPKPKSGLMKEIERTVKGG